MAASSGHSRGDRTSVGVHSCRDGVGELCLSYQGGSVHRALRHYSSLVAWRDIGASNVDSYHLGLTSEWEDVPTHYSKTEVLRRLQAALSRSDGWEHLQWVCSWTCVFCDTQAVERQQISFESNLLHEMEELRTISVRLWVCKWRSRMLELNVPHILLFSTTGIIQCKSLSFINIAAYFRNARFYKII
jgi:hypothetical protein